MRWAAHATTECVVCCPLNLELFARNPEGRDDSSAGDSAPDNEAYAAHPSVTAFTEVSAHKQVHTLARLVSDSDPGPARRNRTMPEVEFDRDPE